MLLALKRVGQLAGVRRLAQSLSPERKLQYEWKRRDEEMWRRAKGRSDVGAMTALK